MPPADVETDSTTRPMALPQGGCYPVQILVVGRQKPWRDDVSIQVRRMGFHAIACDRGVDAMTVLALGLPVNVMVIDSSLQGSLCCAQLAAEARALRPSLRIVLSGDPLDELGREASRQVPDVLLVRRDGFQNGMVARTVRAVLAKRAA